MLARKASSRLGPDDPLGLARASVWQEPHLATNAFLPSIRLALSAPLTEQPGRGERQPGQHGARADAARRGAQAVAQRAARAR